MIRLKCWFESASFGLYWVSLVNIILKGRWLFPFAEGRSLQFGELISTSNEMKDDRITVKADGPLLWTTELTLT
jgi:hypothetical protein